MANEESKNPAASNSRQEAKNQESVGMSAFVIEADHPRNRTLLIKSLPNMKLRSAFSAHKPHVDSRSGTHHIPLSQVQSSTLPQTPGMQLAVHPNRRTWQSYDPLSDDPELMAQVNGGGTMMTSGMQQFNMRAVPSRQGTLGVDEFKSLVREMVDLLEAGEAKVVNGVAPSREQVDALPGRYLLNPGNLVRSTQPRYEEDFEGWVAELGRVGG